jgi:hypothetical protein
MEMSIGEVADRYSIVKLKIERTNLDCKKELAELRIELQKTEGIDNFVERLYDVNGKIWDLESDIRKGKEGILGLEEVGRRAIAIREYNNLRVNIKNEINVLYNSGYIETKVNHASE